MSASGGLGAVKRWRPVELKTDAQQQETELDKLEFHPLLTQSAYGIRIFAPRYDLAELQKVLEQMQTEDFYRSGLWNKTKQTALEQALRQKERQAPLKVGRTK